MEFGLAFLERHPDVKKDFAKVAKDTANLNPVINAATTLYDDAEDAIDLVDDFLTDVTEDMGKQYSGVKNYSKASSEFHNASRARDFRLPSHPHKKRKGKHHQQRRHIGYPMSYKRKRSSASSSRVSKKAKYAVKKIVKECIHNVSETRSITGFLNNENQPEVQYELNTAHTHTFPSPKGGAGISARTGTEILVTGVKLQMMINFPVPFTEDAIFRWAIFKFPGHQSSNHLLKELFLQPNSSGTGKTFRDSISNYPMENLFHQWNSKVGSVVKHGTSRLIAPGIGNSGYSKQINLYIKQNQKMMFDSSQVGAAQQNVQYVFVWTILGSSNKKGGAVDYDAPKYNCQQLLRTYYKDF